MIQQIFVFIHHFSYLGIFIAAIFSGYIIPVPEEVLLLTVGYAASTGYINLIFTIILVIVAFIISDFIVFKLTIKNDKYVDKFIQDVLEIKFISKHRAWFEKNIGVTIFVFRCIPLMRFVGPVFSGYLKVKDRTFLFFNSLANMFCAPIIILVGYFARRYTAQIAIQLNGFRYSTSIIFWIFIGFIVTRIGEHFYKMRKARINKEKENIQK
jgi:membrane protein DedA with SNARE-associated domain